MARGVTTPTKAAANDRLKIFISYSRRDAAAADAIVAALTARGFDVTIDTRDLPFGEKWQAELAEFIRLSDTVIWLVSEASIKSPWVNWELDEVARRNKRLVPLMVGLVNPAELPRQLGEIHILPPDHVFDLSRNLDTLAQVLETDHAWLKQASRLQDRAHEWLTKSRTAALLLSRGALSDAERWKDGRPAKAPAPAQEVLDLLLASRQAANRLQRRVVMGSVAAALVAIGLASIAWLQRLQAVQQEGIAIAQRDQALISQSRFLADRAIQLFGRRDFTSATLLADEALPDPNSPIKRPYVVVAEQVLNLAMKFHLEHLQLTHDDAIAHIVFNHDSTRVLTTSFDHTARIWNGNSGDELLRLPHNGPVDRGAFNPTGEQVLTVSREDDGTARVWNTESGAELFRLQNVAYASYSQDGLLIVTASENQIARVWDARTGEELKRLEHDAALNFAMFDPSGDRILTMARGGAHASVWDIRTGRILAKLSGPSKGQFTSATFSHDGQTVLTSSIEGLAIIWDSISGKELRSFGKETNGELSFAVYNSGSNLIATAEQKLARIWDATTGKELHQLDYSGKPTSIQFGAHDRFLSVTTDSGYAHIYGVEYGNELARFQHESPVSFSAFSHDGNMVATASGDLFPDGDLPSVQHAKLWKVKNPKLVELREHGRRIYTGSFSRDCEMVATGSFDETAKIWQSATGKELHSLGGHGGTVSHAEFSSKSGHILTIADDRLRVWSVTTGSLLQLLEGRFANATFDPSGDAIATASFEKENVGVFDRSSGKRLIVLDGHESGVLHVAYDQLGTRIVTSSQDGTARIWSATDGAQIQRLPHGRDVSVKQSTFSRDGRLVMTVSDRSVIVWDAIGGKLMSEIKLQSGSGSFESAEFSADSKTVLTSATEATIWDAMSGREIRRILVPGLHGAGFSPDDQRIVTWSGDSSVSLWGAVSGAELARFPGWRDDARYGLGKFCPTMSEGRYLLLSLAGARVARVWAAFETTEQMQAQARSQLARCLTPLERKQNYLDEAPPRWCITGAGLESEKNASKWQPRWPYQASAWRDWLMARDRGEKSPLPRSE